MSPLPKKILLATDGSEDARLAARAAADLSNKVGAELHIVHAWQSVPHPVIDPDQYEGEAARLLKEQTEFVSDAGGTVNEAHLVMGAPVDAILDLGEEIGADLVVVAPRHPPGPRAEGRARLLAAGAGRDRGRWFGGGEEGR